MKIEKSNPASYQAGNLFAMNSILRKAIRNDDYETIKTMLDDTQIDDDVFRNGLEMALFWTKWSVAKLLLENDRVNHGCVEYWYVGKMLYRRPEYAEKMLRVYCQRRGIPCGWFKCNKTKNSQFLVQLHIKLDHCQCNLHNYCYMFEGGGDTEQVARANTVNNVLAYLEKLRPGNRLVDEAMMRQV